MIVHNRDLDIAFVDSGLFGTWGVFGQNFNNIYTGFNWCRPSYWRLCVT